MLTARYETDFYQWALQQADRLRNQEYADLDIENLAEEIEAMAKRDRCELFSRLPVLLLHLLRWHHQPSQRTPSWSATLDEQRNALALFLEDSPSLRRELPEMIVKAYPKAITRAIKETGLPADTFPARCTWTIEQILDADYLP
jgi:hypothetical protein